MILDLAKTKFHNMFLCQFQQQDVGSGLSESQEPKPLSLTLLRGNSTNTTQN
jgi:hypothetical protein